MIVDSSADDIVPSDAITGVTANWMRQSLINAGYDPENMPGKGLIDFAQNGADNKRWQDIWAAGQGVGATDEVNTITELVDSLDQEYRHSVAHMLKLTSQ